MYNNPYMNYQQGFNQQTMNERIDNQIAQLQQMKEQMKNQQQPSINQTFQLAPTHQSTMRYANSLDDVSKELVYADTPYFSRDMSVVWIKTGKNEIKTYELHEIVPQDEKDIKINFLMAQIEELKGMIKNDANVTNDDTEQNATNTSKHNESDGNESKENKSSSLQKVSRSKKE